MPPFINPALARILGGGGVDAPEPTAATQEPFFAPMMTRYGGGLDMGAPEANYGRRAEDGIDSGPPVDDRREKLKARLIDAMERYANYKGPERDKFAKRPKRFDEEDLRRMQLREQAGMEPIAREIEGLQGVLGLTAPAPTKYENVGGNLAEIGPSGARFIEPPAGPEPWQRLGPGEGAYRPRPGGGVESILGPPRAEAPQRPFAVGGQVFDPSATGRDRWLTPPGGVRSEGLPASVAGRAVDAGIVPVPPDDPNYGLYKRVIDGTASKEEQALMRAANAQWARAYQDRLQALGQYSFGAAPSEKDYADAESHANRVRSDYMKQAGAAASPGGGQVPVEVREQQLRGIHPDWSNEQIDDALIEEGY